MQICCRFQTDTGVCIYHTDMELFALLLMGWAQLAVFRRLSDYSRPELCEELAFESAICQQHIQCWTRGLSFLVAV